MSSQQEQSQTQESTPAIRRRMRGPSMPSEEMMRNSIARNLSQILINMTNENYQQQCCKILQVDNLGHGAHMKILALLENIDGQRLSSRTRET